MTIVWLMWINTVSAFLRASAKMTVTKTIIATYQRKFLQEKQDSKTNSTRLQGNAKTIIYLLWKPNSRRSTSRVSFGTSLHITETTPAGFGNIIMILHRSRRICVSSANFQFASSALPLSPMPSKWFFCSHTHPPPLYPATCHSMS